jgi:hypothetical protein
MPNTTARVIAHFREVDTQSYYPIFNSGKRNLLKQFKAPLRRGNGPREAPKVHFFEKAKAAAVALRDAEKGRNAREYQALASKIAARIYDRRSKRSIYLGRVAPGSALSVRLYQLGRWELHR